MIYSHKPSRLAEETKRGPIQGRASKQIAAKSADHAVIVHYALAGGDHGTEAQREAIFALEDRLVSGIDASGAGEFDGNEFGGGEAVLYAYGPHANDLSAAVAPRLLGFDARPAYAILRFGDAADPSAVEHRIDL